MKNIILVLASFLMYFHCFSQGNTKITINIPEQDTSRLEAQIFLQDPTEGINKGYYKDTILIKNGQCQFSFDIKNPSLVTLIINNKFVAYPGPYDLFVEPFDDLVIEVPPLKNAGHYGFGIVSIKISGKGSEKINLTKNIVDKYFEIFKTDPLYEKQSLAYMFETTDRKLNVIDSIYKLNSTVPIEMKDLIKAQLYGGLFVSLYRSCMTSKNDSLQALFQKYIVNKNRMDVYFKKGIISYSGSGVIPSYLILSELLRTAMVQGNDYQNENRMAYAEILSLRLQDFPEVRDYLLSDHLINSILAGFDSTTKDLYEFYVDQVNFNNLNYQNVVETYQEMQEKLAVGKPFYNFSLPDSTGKIHSLSDFKGKVLVIDFWYNGCGGCKLMVPAIEQIEKEFTKSSVQFISIGIDKKDLWLQGIGKYSSSYSLQLYTADQRKFHPMMKYLNIDAYPRLIIVDKNGNITSAPADPRIDQKKFLSQIRVLL